MYANGIVTNLWLLFCHKLDRLVTCHKIAIMKEPYESKLHEKNFILFYLRIQLQVAFICCCHNGRIPLKMNGLITNCSRQAACCLLNRFVNLAIMGVGCIDVTIRRCLTLGCTIKDWKRKQEQGRLQLRSLPINHCRCLHDRRKPPMHVLFLLNIYFELNRMQISMWNCKQAKVKVIIRLNALNENLNKSKHRMV